MSDSRTARVTTPLGWIVTVIIALVIIDWLFPPLMSLALGAVLVWVVAYLIAIVCWMFNID